MTETIEKLYEWGWIGLVITIVIIIIPVLLISIPFNLSKIKEQQKETNRILIEQLKQREKIIEELKRINK